MRTVVETLLTLSQDLEREYMMLITSWRCIIRKFLTVYLLQKSWSCLWETISWLPLVLTMFITRVMCNNITYHNDQFWFRNVRNLTYNPQISKIKTDVRVWDPDHSNLKSDFAVFIHSNIFLVFMTMRTLEIESVCYFEYLQEMVPPLGKLRRLEHK